MKSITLEVLENPLFVTGAVTSFAMLTVLRLADYAAAAAETRTIYDRTRGLNVARPAARIRFGRHPILGEISGGRGLLNPAFLLTTVLVREPMSILPMSYAWLEMVLGDLQTGIIVAAVALLWRLCFDLFTMPAEIPPHLRRITVGLKLLWVVTTGVWLATVFITFVCAVFVLMALAAFAASGGRKRRRP